MERISARLLVVESILKRLEPVDELLARVAELEDKVYTTKSIFTFTEACTYLGISKSLLGSPAKPCGLSIDSRKSKQEEFSVYDASELRSELFDFSIERFSGCIGRTVDKIV